MPYIGKQPLTGAYQLCDTITTSATATYNLTVGGSAVIPGSAQNCIVSLNGVIQAPVGAFTVSGSQITFASALTSTDVIDFILILGNVFDIGTPTNGSVNTSKLSTDLTVTHALGSASTPSITFNGDTNTGIFSPTADTIAFTEGGTEAMRITSDGRLGIGTSTPTNRLEISSTGDALFKASRGTNDFVISQENNVGGVVYIGPSVASPLVLTTTNTERMRITSGGNIAIATTGIPDVGNNSNTGFGVQGTAGPGYTAIARDDNTALNVARQSTDGVIIGLWQGGTQEGNISVSGATVSYNGFTGSHWSRFIDGSKPDVLRGTVLESLDQMNDWYVLEFQISTIEKDEDGNDVVKTSTQKESYALKVGEKEGDIITYNFKGEDYQATIVKEKDVKHVMSKISDTVEAKNVYGVFSAWDNDDLINNDFYVASVGSFVVRIKAGQVVYKGDLLQSNGDGTAKVQADDIIRASTFAKVLSNTVIETYEDGSFIVPCSLMC